MSKSYIRRRSFQRVEVNNDGQSRALPIYVHDRRDDLVSKPRSVAMFIQISTMGGSHRQHGYGQYDVGPDQARTVSMAQAPANP